MMPTAAVSQERLNFVGRRLRLNSLSGAARFIVVSSVYLFLYPFLLHSLKEEKFGLWILLGMISQYAVLGDLGITNAIIKQVAEMSPDHRKEEIEKLVGSATVVYLFFGTLATTVAFVFHRQIVTGLRIRPELALEAKPLLFGGVLVLCLTLLTNVYTSLLSGLHRMDLANLVQTAGSLLSAGGFVVAIRLHAGLTGMMVSTAISALASWGIATFAVRLTFALHWSMLPPVDLKMVRGLLSFGGYMYIAGLSTLLLDPVMKMLLSRYGGLEWVSEFELASRGVNQVRSFFVGVMFPLLPAASLLSRELDSIRVLFARTMRLLWLTAVPIFLLIGILAKPIVVLWLGTSPPHIEYGLTILSLACLFNVITVPAYLFVQGIGRPHLAMLCSVIQGAASVAGGWWTIPRIGFYGSVYSEGAAFVLAAVYVFASFLWCSRMSLRGLLGESPARELLPPVAFVGLLLALRAVAPSSPRIEIGIAMASLVGLVLVFYRDSAGGESCLQLVRRFFSRKSREEAAV